MLKGAQIGPGSKFDYKFHPDPYKAKALGCANSGQVENHSLDLTKGSFT